VDFRCAGGRSGDRRRRRTGFDGTQPPEQQQEDTMSERKPKNPMSERALKRLEEQAQPFLEPNEHVELGAWGLPFSFANLVLNTLPAGGFVGRREVLLTDRNIYVLELGRSVLRSRRPQAVLAKHARGSVSVTCKSFPAMLSVGEDRINPNPYRSFVYAKWIAKHAGDASVQTNGAGEPGIEARA
jgi:hypothetical protein